MLGGNKVRRELKKGSLKIIFVEPTNKVNRLRSFSADFFYVSKTYGWQIWAKNRLRQNTC